MLIVDISVLVAATDRNDRCHQACAELLSSETEPLVTTGLVIAETAYLLDRELGPVVEATLYQAIPDGQLTVEALTMEAGSGCAPWSSATPTCGWAAPTPA